MSILEEIENSQMKENTPEVNVGDTVSLSKEIVEGKKKRIQKFEGIVTQKKNNRSRASITIRKIVDGSGVEKTFLIHSPLVTDIEVKKRGKVRRSKLYYLRDRVGKKATRIKSAD